MLSATQIIKSIIGKLFYYIYPTICPVCNRVIDRRFCLCAHCWSKVYLSSMTN
ncbi:double zinc ribbon domain-containing protein [Candidatus Liberibacter africanus]|uniref:double zinc ribbon domain-containing protein n=1 Tax=Liberibacter africanus TaxID=34020 RepID=UPI00339D6B93